MAGGAQVLGLLQQFEDSQWLGPDALEALQLEQLDALLRHAWASVPFYRERWQGRYDPGKALTMERFRALPLLTRRDLQTGFDALRSGAVPETHGEIFEAATSGSTGAPVRVLKTALSAIFWNALTLRDHAWHRRDLSGKLAAIRTSVTEGRASNWGAATHGLVETGPVAILDVERERDEQLRWLEREQPDYLLTHASSALSLARRSLAIGAPLRLREVRTFGDLLDPATPEACAQAWGARVTDTYSAIETGYLALQCPGRRHYHVQSEAALVEVLDAAGRPCRAGEVGRVVLTMLHGFAMPLIRYAIGDFAGVGEACPCGRGLPVLDRIAGRTRNLMRTADGRTYWPYLGSVELAHIAPVRHHQFVQKSFDLVEARLIVDAPLTAGQEQAVRALFEPHLPAGIRLQIAYVESFPGSAGGKFEYFVSEVPGE